MYFDSGDCVKAGNLAISLREEPVWSHLAELRCTASTIGNRESQVNEAAFWMKMKGYRHPVLCANMRRKDGTYPLQNELELECGGLHVGVFGVMVPMVTERMKLSAAASSFLWEQPIPVAREVVKRLKVSSDLLIALTHIGLREDRKLAEACPEIDLILGGHSHDVLEEPERIGKTWICQGGSHGRFAGVYRWTPGAGLTESELVPLTAGGRVKGR